MRNGAIRYLLILAIGLIACAAASGQVVTTPNGPETPEQFAARTKWWREAKFGMFVHWGVYSVPADVTTWDGKKSAAEWYLSNKNAQVRDYEKFAPQFNPVNFNARKFVATAREAGMKYIVITSKHHDGFCMFGTKLQHDWNIVDATPFHRDPLKELAAECKRQGIRLGFYYSIMDWHHPEYLPRRPWEINTRPGKDASLDRYIEYMKGQLTELLTNYGPVAVIWFDGGWEHDPIQLHSVEVNRLIRKLQPNVIINDRNHLPEDHATPEQSIPANAMPNGRLWETCMTMNDTWGYGRNDTNWKSATDLIHKLCDIASKGGNFLLNVGPTNLGEIPEASVERLKHVGEWMKTNSKSIYATTKSPFRRVPFDGRCTVKGDRLYLQVFAWPEEGLALHGLKTAVREAHALLGGEKLAVTTQADEVRIAKPSRLDPDATVVELRLAGPPEVEAG
jgi:alpha-L-fucosidase